VSHCAHDTANKTPQLPNVQIIALQAISFDRYVGLVFLLKWIADEDPLNYFHQIFNQNQTKFSVVNSANAG
jgi:general stress protein CsbA